MATWSRARAATGRERAQARGLGTPTVRLWVGLLAGGGHAQAWNPEFGERSASAPQARMR
eukprot:6200748-Pleurochrysis_carterae.AAC.1